MKTQYYVASTLDGFVATEEDSLDWLFALGSATSGRGKPLLPRRIVGPAISLRSMRRLGPEMVELRYLLGTS